MKKYTKIKEGIHPKDNIFPAIDYEELIQTVEANEEFIDEQAILDTFEDMVSMYLTDARFELKRYARLLVKMIGR